MFKGIAQDILNRINTMTKISTDKNSLQRRTLISANVLGKPENTLKGIIGEIRRGTDKETPDISLPRPGESKENNQPEAGLPGEEDRKGPGAEVMRLRSNGRAQASLSSNQQSENNPAEKEMARTERKRVCPKTSGGRNGRTRRRCSVDDSIREFMESTGLDRTTLLEHRIVYKQYENSPQNHGRRRLQPQASSSTQKSYKSRSSRDREKCDKDTKAASCEKKQTVDNTPEADLVTLSENAGKNQDASSGSKAARDESNRITMTVENHGEELKVIPGKEDEPERDTQPESLQGAKPGAPPRRKRGTIEKRHPKRVSKKRATCKNDSKNKRYPLRDRKNQGKRSVKAQAKVNAKPTKPNPPPSNPSVPTKMPKRCGYWIRRNGNKKWVTARQARQEAIQDRIGHPNLSPAQQKLVQKIGLKLPKRPNKPNRKRRRPSRDSSRNQNAGNDNPNDTRGSSSTLRSRTYKKRTRPMRPRDDVTRMAKKVVKKTLPEIEGDFKPGVIVEAVYDDGKWYDVKILKREDFYTFNVLWMEDNVQGVMQYYDLRPKDKEPTFDEGRPMKSKVAKLLWELRRLPVAWAFREPVDPKLVPTYHEVIEKPMDLLTMKVKNEMEHYENMMAFVADFFLLYRNCLKFNGCTSRITKNAVTLRSKFRDRIHHLFPRVRLDLLEIACSPRRKKKASQVSLILRKVSENRLEKKPTSKKTGKREAETSTTEDELEEDAYHSHSEEIISKQEIAEKLKQLEREHLHCLGILPAPAGRPHQYASQIQDLHTSTSTLPDLNPAASSESRVSLITTNSSSSRKNAEDCSEIGGSENPGIRRLNSTIRRPEAGMRVGVRFDDGEVYEGRIALCGILCSKPKLWRVYIKYDDGELQYDVYPDPKQAIQLLESNSDDLPICPLVPGDHCDCKDSRGDWCPAVVVGVDDDKKDPIVHIHYVGWTDRWDEHIPYASQIQRFAPLYNYSKPTLRLVQYCPLPQPPPEPVHGLRGLEGCVFKERSLNNVRAQIPRDWGFRRGEGVTDGRNGTGTVEGIRQGMLFVEFKDLARLYTKTQAMNLLRQTKDSKVTKDYKNHRKISRSRLQKRKKLPHQQEKKPHEPCVISEIKLMHLPTMSLPSVDTVRKNIKSFLPDQAIDIPGCRKYTLDLDDPPPTDETSSSEEDTSDEWYFSQHTEVYRQEIEYWRRRELEKETEQIEEAVEDQKLNDHQRKKIQRLKSLLGRKDRKERRGGRQSKKKPKKPRKGEIGRRKKKSRKIVKIRIQEKLEKTELRFNYTFSALRWKKPEHYIKLL
ncbi:hypothetical protein AAMO2058_001057900 [Amorphochlora amoebiformis]